MMRFVRNTQVFAAFALSLATASCATTPPPPPPQACMGGAGHMPPEHACPCCGGGMHGMGGHGGMPGMAGHEGMPGMEHGGMAALPPAVSEFHTVLRPLWHAEPGAERDANTCAQSAALRTRADAVVAAPVPEAASADAEGWRGATGALQRTTVALVASCAATPRAGVADGLAGVHTAFHAVVERVGHHGPPGAQ